MRILFLATNEYGDVTSGQGVIITNTLANLALMPDIEVALGVFRPLDAFRADLLPAHPSLKLPAVNTLFQFKGTPYNRLKMLRGMFKVSSPDELEFLQAVAKISRNYDLAIWCGSAYEPVTLRLPDYSHCPILFHLNDSPLLYEQRQIIKGFKFLRTWLAAFHEKRIIASGFKRVIYVSQEDYATGLRLAGPRYLSKVICLPTGVDINLFCPDPSAFGNDSAKIVLLFTGTMFYQPNVDAALYLIKEIMPKIRHAIQLQIAGRDPVPAITEAAKADSRIVVTGTVSDMAAVYRRADIFIAPMISAAGIKIKILQAMASALPVVATPMCVEAFPQEPSGILTGRTTEEIVAIIERLIQDEEWRRELGRQGRKFVETEWSWEHRTQKLLKICRQVSADQQATN